MTEDEARAWVAAKFDAGIVEVLEHFASLLIDENERQNLIASSTVPLLWSRHIVDSLQLLQLTDAHAPWLDVGTGGGFPGLVVAVATDAPTMLVEPRKRRAEFLQACVDRLELRHVQVATKRVEAVAFSAAVISARAVDSIANLLRASWHCAKDGTRWLLPRGSVDHADLRQLAARSGKVFHVEQSLTDPYSHIVVIR